jgi:prophage DNA circulation protein
MRDWKKTLLPASFRGVPFFVEYEDLSGGRRLAMHEYAGSEQTDVEDLGASTRTYDVTAYTLGETADLKALTLQSAVAIAGPGLLVLPMDGGFLAHVQGFRRTRQKDKAGYIAFDITFVPKAQAAGAILSIGDVTSAASTGLTAAAAAFARLF